MAIGRPMPLLILDDTERETLERWVRRPKTTQGLALRARMILARAEGRSNIAVAADLEGVKWIWKRGRLANQFRIGRVGRSCPQSGARPTAAGTSMKTWNG